MIRKIFVSTVVGLAVMAISAISGSAAIKGDYIEARSADVYTGPCFANGQVGLVGNEAILAWKIKEGEWKGASSERLGRCGCGEGPRYLGRSVPQSLSRRVCADC